MSSDWAHSFCLTCDKQTDGTTYCSESCRLADYETTSSTSSSGPSSPAFTGSSYPWSFSKPVPTSTKFYLSPAYDFAHAQPYGSNTTTTAKRNDSLTPPNRILSPSSSHSSLCSMRSSSSAGTDAASYQQLSEKARKELLAYASSFENVRLQRRRSY